MAERLGFPIEPVESTSISISFLDGRSHHLRHLGPFDGPTHF